MEQRDTRSGKREQLNIRDKRTGEQANTQAVSERVCFPVAEAGAAQVFLTCASWFQVYNSHN